MMIAFGSVGRGHNRANIHLADHAFLAHIISRSLESLASRERDLQSCLRWQFFPEKPALPPRPRPRPRPRHGPASASAAGVEIYDVITRVSRVIPMFFSPTGALKPSWDGMEGSRNTDYCKLSPCVYILLCLVLLQVLT